MNPQIVVLGLQGDEVAPQARGDAMEEWQNALRLRRLFGCQWTPVRGPGGDGESELNNRNRTEQRDDVKRAESAAGLNEGERPGRRECLWNGGNQRDRQQAERSGRRVSHDPPGGEDAGITEQRKAQPEGVAHGQAER